LSSQGILTALYAGLKGGKAIEAQLNGHVEALQQYSENIENIYRHFLINRLRYYQLEQRWPDAPFWKVRQEQELAVV
ncbi:MAG: hypothetical protein AAFP19_22700, partial [Bacteroidota bacterium]